LWGKTGDRRREIREATDLDDLEAAVEPRPSATFEVVDQASSDVHLRVPSWSCLLATLLACVQSPTTAEEPPP
jgi:hypothetical protein